MKTYQNTKNSLKLTLITLYTGLMAIGCTPSQPPATQAPSQPPATQTSSAPQTPPAPISTPTQTPAKQAPTSTTLQTAKPKECRISLIKIADPNPPANVRSSPEVKPDNIIGSVENGRIVYVSAEQDNWLKIREPEGWISKSIAETNCPPQKECKIVNQGRIADPNPPTNVRSSPEVKPDNIVGTLQNGKIVFISAEQNNWVQISEPKGWISKSILETECSEKTETISFNPNNNSTTINGRFIGTGSHTYLFTGKEGQTLTVTVKEGGLPFIISPNQKELSGGGDYTGKKSWTGKLPASGEYKIQFESNFKGYNYNVSVQLQ